MPPEAAAGVAKLLQKPLNQRKWLIEMERAKGFESVRETAVRATTCKVVQGGAV